MSSRLASLLLSSMIFLTVGGHAASTVTATPSEIPGIYTPLPNQDCMQPACNESKRKGHVPFGGKRLYS